MFKLKNILLSQVFTLFISFEALGGGGPIYFFVSGDVDNFQRFKAAYAEKRYDDVNQLTEQVFDSLAPKLGREAFIERSSHLHKDSNEPTEQDEAFMKMKEFLLMSTVSALRMKNMNEILKSIYRLHCYDDPVTRLQKLSIFEFLGVEKEILEPQRNITKTEGLTEDHKRILLFSEQSFAKVLKEIQKESAENSLRFIEEKKLTFNEDSEKEISTSWNLLDWLSRALEFSVFKKHYINERYDDAVPLFSNVIKFAVDCAENLKQITFDRIARIIVHKRISKLELDDEIDDRVFSSLQGAVDRVTDAKNSRRMKLSRRVIEKKIIEKEDKSDFYAQQLLEEFENKKPTKSKKTTKKTDEMTLKMSSADLVTYESSLTGTEETELQLLKAKKELEQLSSGMSGKTKNKKNKTKVPESTLEPIDETQAELTRKLTRELDKMNLKLSSAQEENAAVQSMEQLTKEEELTIESLIQKDEIAVLTEKDKKSKKQLKKMSKENALLKEENAQLLATILKMQGDKKAGSERGKLRYLELLWLQNQLKNKEAEIKALKGTSKEKKVAEQECEELQNTNFQEENERLRMLEQLYNNTIAQHHLAVHQAFMNGQAFTYFQLSQEQALQREFVMTEFTGPRTLGVVTPWGGWYPIVMGENGVMGFFVGGNWYPL